MTRSITLELTDALIERAQTEAQRSGQPLETVLTLWLEKAARQNSETAREGVQHVFTPMDSSAVAHELQKIADDYQTGNLNADKRRS